MSEKTPTEQIRELMIEELGWQPLSTTALGGLVAPFDITQPNIHENKAEFLYELNAVEGVVEHTEAIISKLFKSTDDNTPQHREMTNRLIPSIDQYANKTLNVGVVTSASDLTQRNIVLSGFYWNSLTVIIHMMQVYRERLRELQDQEQEFWSVNHRPPNYYARAIALRLARFYAKETGKKPTFGTSSDGPHPSTDYSRLLEKVFSVLEINSALRNPATYAIGQITDEDVKPASSLSRLMELADSVRMDPNPEFAGIISKLGKTPTNKF